MTADLYDAAPDDVLDAVHQAAPTDAGTVIFVGHNPTAEDLAILLADGAGDDEALRARRGRAPDVRRWRSSRSRRLGGAAPGGCAG